MLLSGVTGSTGTCSAIGAFRHHSTSKMARRGTAQRNRRSSRAQSGSRQPAGSTPAKPRPLQMLPAQSSTAMPLNSCLSHEFKTCAHEASCKSKATIPRRLCHKQLCRGFQQDYWQKAREWSGSWLPTWPTRKRALANMSQPPSLDSVPLSPKLRQPCSSSAPGGDLASLEGVHSAKKGSSANIPTPKDSDTNGQAGICTASVHLSVQHTDIRREWA